MNVIAIAYKAPQWVLIAPHRSERFWPGKRLPFAMMHLLRNHAAKLLLFSQIRNSCPELRNIFPRCCGFYDFYQDYLENNTPYTINHTPIHHQPYANTPYTNLHILQFTDDRILPIIRGQNFKYINYLYIYFFVSNGSLRLANCQL